MRALLIGDSITAGYAPFARAACGLDLHGPDGNARDSRTLLAVAAAVEDRYEVIHVNCGLHDLKRYDGADGPAVPVPEYAANVARAVGILRGRAGTVAWARTTPVAAESRKGGYRRLGADVDRYNTAADAALAGLDVPVDDLHAVLVRAGAATSQAADGVHLTETGYRTLGTAVGSFLDALVAGADR